MDTPEVVLTYFGTVLIAIEFVRKTTDLQAFMGMIVGWPVAGFFKENGRREFLEAFHSHGLNMTIRVIFSLTLSIGTLPLTVFFYIIWFIILCLNSLQNTVNKYYHEGKYRYRYLYKYLIGINLFALKLKNPGQSINVKDKQVMKEIEKRDIPIIPLLGIILITIALILYFV